MLSLVLALVVAGGTPAQGDADFDARMRESIAAAESLQGPLDGGWTLFVSGRPTFALQIVDPAGGGPLQAAWRDWEGGEKANLGVAAEVLRAGRSLRLTLRRPGATEDTHIRLWNVDRQGWRGKIVEAGHTARAVLRRN